MNYGAIKKHDVANGLGVRVSLFVSGCTHHCPECFNEEAWDFSYGQPFTKAVEEEIISALKPEYIRGFSLLGGEPFEPANQEVLVGLLRNIKEKYPEKTIWCYSGYLFDTEMLTGKLGNPKITREMLSYIDILVDGEFHIAEKNLNLRFRGSSNQRIINVPESLKTDKIVLWNDEEEL
jgi:anaerobic ribonucleoside-triphosphate reductase activating protein